MGDKPYLVVAKARQKLTLVRDEKVEGLDAQRIIVDVVAALRTLEQLYATPDGELQEGEDLEPEQEPSMVDVWNPFKRR